MSTVNLDIANRLSVKCRQGNDFKWTLDCDEPDGSPKDVTRYTFVMKVIDPTTKETILDFTDVDFTKSIDGTLVIKKEKAVMDLVEPGTYIYDLDATETSENFTQTWLFGNFTVNSNIL